MSKHHISCFSKGLASNWFWHHPSRTLFDCGDGITSWIGNFVYGIERICISHNHADHIGGLITLIGLRNSGRGDKEKKLSIYYPSGDMIIHQYKDFINLRYKGWLSFEIEWVPVFPGSKIELDKNHWIEVFNLEHNRKFQTLGYKIVEARSRLKPQFTGKDIPALLKSGYAKANELNEPYNAIMFAYCLDAYKLNPNDIAGANLAVMDCSFLRAGDRDEKTHFTLDESAQICKDVGVKQMGIAHISSRYSYKESVELVKDCGIPYILIGNDRIWEI